MCVYVYNRRTYAMQCNISLRIPLSVCVVHVHVACVYVCVCVCAHVCVHFNVGVSENRRLRENLEKNSLGLGHLAKDDLTPPPKPWTRSSG